MASSHCPNLPANPSRFFKILLCDIGSHSKLMIPRKLFATIFQKNPINRIYLNVSNGSVWSVDLEKHKDEVWLQNGWPEFAKYYSLSFGYLLVFEYKGDSKFQVLIFDPSALEIDYHLTCSPNLDYVKSTQVRKKEMCPSDAAHSEAIRLRKKTRSNSAHIEPCRNEQKLGNEIANVNGKSARNVEENSDLSWLRLSNLKGRFSSFLCNHRTLMQILACIPAAFREVYTKWMNNVEVILKVGRRTWPVYSHLCIKWNRCTFSSGWARFARDNSLNVGDACVFELINPATRLFKVFMFRATTAL